MSSASSAAARCAGVEPGSASSACAVEVSSCTPASKDSSSPCSSTSGRPADRNVSKTVTSMARRRSAPYVARSCQRSGSSAAHNPRNASLNASPWSTPACGSVRTRKRGSIPASSGYAPSTRRQKPWIVEIHAPSSSRARSGRSSSSSRRRILERSSPAAFSVYVITRSESTSTPSSITARVNRSTRTVVFPVPAPAATNTRPRASIASSCCAFGVLLTPGPSDTSARDRTRPGTCRRSDPGGCLPA